jgi:uncharacterized protein (DUF1697 family)
MKTYVLLLRGVMPVGKNKVPMAALRQVLADTGFKNVRTYIASGNALVDTDIAPKDLEVQVHELIKTHIGPDLVVVARTGTQLQKVLDENPFTKGYDISRVFFASFASSPSEQKVKALLAQDFSPEEIIITEHTAYLYLPGNAARAKLTNAFLEKQLGVSMTARNFNTMSKLIEMSKER